MRHARWAGLVSLVIVLGASEAWAGDPGYKLGRGAVNLLFGWMAYPSHFRDCMGESDPGFLYVPCMAKAIVPTLLHEALGAVEVVTFPIPWPLRDYDSPYTNWSPGDYPWQRDWSRSRLRSIQAP